MLVLGLNAYHADAAACLYLDGRLLAAVEEERFRRIKHWAGFPSEAIRYCLQVAGAGPQDLDVVAVNSDPKAAWGRRLLHVLRHRPQLGSLWSRWRHRRQRRSLATDWATCFPDAPLRARIEYVPHHLAHLASAYYGSTFDDAVVVSVDGFGDFASGAWGYGQADRLQLQGQVYFPHSLGIFYQALTQYLGFPHYGDEYKVMGLAPYGEPTYLDALRRVLRPSPGGYELELRYFRHHREPIAFHWPDGVPRFPPLYSAELEALLGPARAPGEPIEQRHRDLARSVQALYEECFFHLLEGLRTRRPSTQLAIAGGCGANSVANGWVTRRTGFRQVYVQAAPGDAGGALGAAAIAVQKASGRRPEPMPHAYWGPEYDQAAVRACLDGHAERIAASDCRAQHFDAEPALLEYVARALSEGAVVGWFQGRMEWGPRALGHRSILADPRRADMKDVLNAKIKRRESFRPFAPSVLREHVAEWFELDHDVPFMSMVFPIRPERRSCVPAVTHVDGTGRLQTVTRAQSPRYWGLIEAFRRLTGVPMVLNTSFNENEPVVCRPEEALDCFLRTHMDVLVLGDYVLERRAVR